MSLVLSAPCEMHHEPFIMIERPAACHESAASFGWSHFPVIQEQLVNVPSSSSLLHFNKSTHDVVIQQRPACDILSSFGWIDFRVVHQFVNAVVFSSAPLLDYNTLTRVVIQRPPACDELLSFGWSDFPVLRQFVNAR
jgi:hypothetical protein